MDFDTFDYDRIPDYILHEAARETLGDCKLEGGNGSTPYVFRCPICGDSKKNPNLKRGHLYFTDGWIYHCFNECGSMSFFTFLKERHQDVYRRVIFHAFDRKPRQTQKEDTRTEAEKTFKGVEMYDFKKGELLQITDNHPVAKLGLEYCQERMIPPSVYKKWYVCIRDKKFLNRDAQGHYIYNDKGVPTGNEYGHRLIIPYYRYGGNWIQFDARDLNKKSFLRYRNLEGAPREMYNVDFLNVKEPFFLFEGSIDSTFVRNSVAFGGTKHLLSFLEEHPEILKYAHNGTVVWDNDDAGYDEIPKTAKLGFNWFDWRDFKPLPQFKYYIDDDGNRKERTIKDMNNAVMYTNKFILDRDGFVVLEDLKKYIKKGGGESIPLLTLMHGNREKMRKEKVRKQFEQLKRKKPTEIKPYF